MKYLYIPLLTTLLLIVGCEKDMPSKNLPPITQEGKNTSGFLLDGEVWVPFSKCKFFSNPCNEIHARYGAPYAGPNELEIALGRNVEGLRSSFIITSFLPIKKSGDYFSDVNITFFSDKHEFDESRFTKHSDYPNGKFTITRLDTAARVMAGRFNFTLRNREGETVEITEGRFDFEMNACICR